MISALAFFGVLCGFTYLYNLCLDQLIDLDPSSHEP